MTKQKWLRDSYASIFKNSTRKHIVYYGESGAVVAGRAASTGRRSCEGARRSVRLGLAPGL